MAHLSYQPLLPTGNKYLQLKWDKASYDLHREKVKSAKSTINTSPPKSFGHVTLRLKKQKLEEEWTAKIQRENNMLKEKILRIMRTTGGVDNRNFYDKKSLGKERRERELLRITKENQMILLRLNQCRSHYKVRIWHEDWLKTLKVMDSISRYPQRRANQQKEQEKNTKKHTDSAKEKTTADTNKHNPGGNKTNGRAESEGEEKGEETSEKEDTGVINPDIVTHPAPEPNVPEKSISPGSLESPGSPDTIQISADKPAHTAETFPPPDASDTSNTPQTPETPEQGSAE